MSINSIMSAAVCWWHSAISGGVGLIRDLRDSSTSCHQASTTL